MPKIYTKNTWEDEVLAGDERYDIKTNAGAAIETNVQIDLVTAVTTAGTAVDADKMNNLEDGVDALDTLLSSMRSTATELTIASDAITITQSNHKLQPQSGTADDLSTISGTAAGQSGVLYASDYGTDTITIKHNVGNILCMGAADVSLSQGCVFWHSDGTKVFVSGGGGGGGGSYIPTSYLDTDGTLAADSDVKVPTQKAVKTYVDTKITGLLEYRGAFSAAANPNYPGANAGDAYLISGAGKVGGASGKSVDAGDMIVAIAYNVGGTEASVGTSWTVLEHNLEGALLAANNLSDLTNQGTARTNLGMSANGSSLVSAANYAAMKALLDLEIGTDVQAYNAILTTLAGASANGQSLVTAADYGAMLTLLFGTALPENTSIALDAALSADGKYSGITEPATAGATLAFGDLCYLQTSDSRWELADANAAATCSNKLGMCVLAAASDGSATTMLLYGKIRADAAFPALTVGAPVFASTTAGDVQTTAPSGAADIIRIIGYGNTADELHFCPSNDYFEHA